MTSDVATTTELADRFGLNDRDADQARRYFRHLTDRAGQLCKENPGLDPVGAIWQAHDLYGAALRAVIEEVQDRSPIGRKISEHVFGALYDDLDASSAGAEA